MLCRRDNSVTVIRRTHDAALGHNLDFRAEGGIEGQSLAKETLADVGHSTINVGLIKSSVIGQRSRASIHKTQHTQSKEVIPRSRHLRIRARMAEGAVKARSLASIKRHVP